MSTLENIIEDLAKEADDQIKRAYNILGAHPGPGTDLLIKPIEPVCGRWTCVGLTQAGKNFVAKFWFAQPIESNRELAQLKREATDWKLQFHVEYPAQPIIDNPGIE